MPKSYIGYVPRQQPPVDWGKIATDLITKLEDVREEKAAFREKYDTMANDAWKKLGDYESTKSPTIDAMVFDTAVQGRAMIYEAHQRLKRQEISPEQFQRLTMSMGSGMDQLKTVLENYDASIELTQKGITDGELDPVLAGWSLEQLGELSNLKNASWQWKPQQSGYTNLFAVQTDEEGEITGNPRSMRQLTNANNLTWPKVDVDAQVKAFEESIGKTKIGRLQAAPYEFTSDDRKQAVKEYYEIEQDTINSILNNDKAIASVLVSMGYKPYQKGQAVPEKGIFMSPDESETIMPEITKEMKEAAAEKLRMKFRAKFDYIKTEKTSSTSTKKKGLYTEKELDQMQIAFDNTWEAANATSSDDFSKMDKNKYNFYVSEDGSIAVHKKPTREGQDEFDKDLVVHEGLEPGTAETHEILSQYYPGFNIAKWTEIQRRQTAEGTAPTSTKDFAKINEIKQLIREIEKIRENIKEEGGRTMKVIEKAGLEFKHDTSVGKKTYNELLEMLEELESGAAGTTTTTTQAP